MTHDRVKENIELLLYNELQDDERLATEQHLQGCADCRKEFEELKKLHSVLAQYKPSEVSDRLLSEARGDLQTALREKTMTQSWWEKVSGFVAETIEPQYKIAFGGTLTIAIGFFIGYMAFRSPAVSPTVELPKVQQAVDQRPLLPEGGQIANVKFVDADTRDGNVEFTFDAVMPMHLKGNVNNPQIQQVLSYALLNEQNPGVRLRSVSAMIPEQQSHRDEDVKRILITVLNSDDNPGVRKEALSALQKFPFDKEIKKALMDALVHDTNSGIRIAAINALGAAKTKGSDTDQDLLNILKERIKSDDNQYIRIRAKAVLEEIKQ